MKYKKEDFLLLNSQKNFYGLANKVYWKLKELNGRKEFRSKDELMEFLKTVSKHDLLHQRNFGVKSYQILIKWLENELREFDFLHKSKVDK